MIQSLPKTMRFERVLNLFSLSNGSCVIKVSGVSLLGLDKRIVERDKCWKRSAERKSKVLKARKRTLCKVRDWIIREKFQERHRIKMMRLDNCLQQLSIGWI